MIRAFSSHGVLAIWLLPLLGLALYPAGSGAAQAPLTAAVVFDADSGAVLHASNANRRVRPASLTKLMTALLVMQHMAQTRNAVTHAWSVSKDAAAQPASRLGLRAGREITMGTVLDALLVASANDAAVVAAEAIAGDEAAFAQLMNAKAASLGMTRTHFANASGLPAPQLTTARDIAVLARHLWQTFPAQRKRFAQSGMTYAGRWIGSTNPLLGSYRGALGMKTGFTCRAGFHLVGAAERDGRTLIAVVLGARSADTRLRRIRTLLDEAFANRSGAAQTSLAALASTPGQGENLPPGTAIIATTCLIAKAPSGWNIDVGVRRSKKAARALAREFVKAHRKALRGARVSSIPRYTGVELHRAIVTGLTEERARTSCLDFRKQGGSCIIFGPEIASAELEKAARVRTLLNAQLNAQRAAAPKGSNK